MRFVADRLVNRLDRARPFAPVLALAVLAASSALLRTRAERLAPAAAADSGFDIPAFPAEVVRPFSFGLRSAVSDLMFLQAIQVHGGRGTKMITAHEGARDDRALNRLLTYAVELDPQFAGAYRFAGNAMPRQTTDGKVTNVLQAEALLSQGTRERADDWHIPFTLGFLQSYFLARFEDAGKNFAAAARLPGAPPYVGLLATRTLTEGGDLRLAEQLAAAMADQATEESAQKEWEERLLDLRMERDSREIESAAARFFARTGEQPPSVAALFRSGDLARIPREPHGGRYELAENGEVRSTAKARLRIRGRRGTLAALEVQ